MGKLHFLYEKLRFPIEVIFIGTLLLGIGNIFTNPVFGIVDLIENEWIEAVMEVVMRTGRFIVANFPLVLLLGLSGEKKHISASAAALLGYVIFLVTTAFFNTSTTSSNAYSSILGISVSGSAVSWLSGNTGYPLQTGVFGAACISGIIHFVYHRQEKRNKGTFLFSAEGAAVFWTIVLSFLAGLCFTYIWPYVLSAVSALISFISRDTSNPVKLAVYGIFERLFTITGLGTLIRQPFWFGTNGGSWSNIAGQVITGDVSIWTAKMNQSTSLYGTTGRFITPYYLLNLFAVPGLLTGLYSIETDKKERTKKRVLLFLGIISSALCGTLLPVELTILFLSPLLYVFHILMVGIMYHLLFVLQVFLGYQTASSLTQAAIPGTLSELLSYTSVSSLVPTIIRIAGIGIVLFIIYFFASRLYFHKLASGLLNPPAEKAFVDQLVKAAGGVSNIMNVEASASILRISVYDLSAADMDAMQKLGISGIYETADNEIRLTCGGSSYMLRKKILDQRRSLIRDINL